MTSNQPGRRPPARVRLPLWLITLISLLIVVGVVWSSVWLFRTVRDAVAASAAPTPDVVDFAESASESDAGEETAVTTPNPLPQLKYLYLP